MENSPNPYNNLVYCWACDDLHSKGRPRDECLKGIVVHRKKPKEDIKKEKGGSGKT